MLLKLILYALTIIILNLNNYLILAEDSLNSLSEDIIETGEEIEEEENNIYNNMQKDKKKIDSSTSTLDEVKNDIFNLYENSTNNLKSVKYNVAKIVALNKITAKSQEITIKKGEIKYFGNIEIKMHQCIKEVEPIFTVNKILLTLSENKIDEDPNLLFQGWMISTSISLSTFEHPVYEIFAKDCL